MRNAEQESVDVVDFSDHVASFPQFEEHIECEFFGYFFMVRELVYIMYKRGWYRPKNWVYACWSPFAMRASSSCSVWYVSFSNRLVEVSVDFRGWGGMFYDNSCAVLRWINVGNLIQCNKNANSSATTNGYCVPGCCFVCIDGFFIAAWTFYTSHPLYLAFDNQFWIVSLRTHINQSMWVLFFL